jgi:GDPmannose 4,6-dehydratase
LLHIVKAIQPDEIYNLAAQSHVQVSFETPEYTANVDALGALRILEAIRILDLTKKTKIYQASTSELFGKVMEIPQSETTPFRPQSPYAAAKLYAYWIMINYREAYGLQTYNGILFNHESERRGYTFVTRKITNAVARIQYGLQDKILLGNLDAKRDWGHAKEYVEAMWLMLQKSAPDDFVIATGQTHTVREFVELAFKEIGKTIIWRGQGVHEVGIDATTNNVLVEVSSAYFRPAEVDLLLGDALKAAQKLDWVSTCSLQQLVHGMMKEDLECAAEALYKEIEIHSKIAEKGCLL